MGEGWRGQRARPGCPAGNTRSCCSHRGLWSSGIAPLHECPPHHTLTRGRAREAPGLEEAFSSASSLTVVFSISSRFGQGPRHPPTFLTRGLRRGTHGTAGRGLWTTEASEERQNPRQRSRACGPLLGCGLLLCPGEWLPTPQASDVGCTRRVRTPTQDKPTAGRSLSGVPGCREQRGTGWLSARRRSWGTSGPPAFLFLVKLPRWGQGHLPPVSC